jgi:hypothetical protein
MEEVESSSRQLEWILDVKYVLFIILVFMSVDAYYAALFHSPLCRVEMKELYETFPMGHVIVFICVFPVYYMLALKCRRYFCWLTYKPFLLLPGVAKIREKHDDPMLMEYSVNKYSLLEYALLHNDATLYAEFKDHEHKSMRLVRVCELVFAIAMMLVISLVPPDSSVSVCFEEVGITKWILLIPALLMLVAAAHVPQLFAEHNVFVGKTLATRIHDAVDKD